MNKMQRNMQRRVFDVWFVQPCRDIDETRAPRPPKTLRQHVVRRLLAVAE
jgi:hypothetical protein